VLITEGLWSQSWWAESTWGGHEGRTLQGCAFTFTFTNILTTSPSDTAIITIYSISVLNLFAVVPPGE